MSDNSSDIQKMFFDMLTIMGKELFKKFKVNATQVTPNQQGEFLDEVKPIIKPMMKQAKNMFEDLLKGKFDSSKLASLSSMFDKNFLNGMTDMAVKNGADPAPVALAVQLLTNIGIPMLQNLIGSLAKAPGFSPGLEAHKAKSGGIGSMANTLFKGAANMAHNLLGHKKKPNP